MSDTAMPTTETRDALAMLDQWAEGEAPSDALLNDPQALSQQQMGQMWQILGSPANKATLSMPVSIPR